MRFANRSKSCPQYVLNVNRKKLDKRQYLNEIPKLTCAPKTNSTSLNEIPKLTCKPLAAGIKDVLLWRIPKTNNLWHYILDNISELMFSLNRIIGSSNERMLVVNNHRIEDTFAFRAGWVSLLSALFPGGIRTMNEMKKEICYIVPSITFGHGEIFTSQKASEKQRNFEAIRAAGFAAAGIPAPPSLRHEPKAWMTKRVLHVTRNDSMVLERTLGVDGTEELRRAFKSINFEWSACCAWEAGNQFLTAVRFSAQSAVIVGWINFLDDLNLASTIETLW